MKAAGPGTSWIPIAALLVWCGSAIASPSIAARPRAPSLAMVFSDATVPPLGEEGGARGVAWGDYDNDGDMDLCVANEYGPALLFRNDGGGAFTDVTAGPLIEESVGSAAVWGDYDDDGFLDLFLTRFEGGDRLLRNQGPPAWAFVDVSSSALPSPGDPARGAAWGDFDGDGDLDLMVARIGTPALLLNQGAPTWSFVDATPGAMLRQGSWTGVACGDYDLDGDLDVYLTDADGWLSGGGNRLYRNLGLGTFADVTTPLLLDRGPGHSAAWADYDGDGCLDLAIANAGGRVRLFRNGGPPTWTFSDASGSTFDAMGKWVGLAWADFDLDRDLDLFVTLEDPERPSALYENQGDGTFSEVATAPLTDGAHWLGVASADYDDDGDVDLYVANYGSANRLYRNETGGGGHWLQVRLVERNLHGRAYGARVRVLAGGRWETQQVSGGGGYCSQDSPVLTFGLGELTAADRVVVYWPSGLVQDSIGIGADQRIQILERGAAASVDDASAEGVLLALGPCVPNPTRASTSIRFLLAEPARTRIEILDLAGRRTRLLLAGELATAGEHECTWDGRTDEGSRAVPGIYFCRVSVGEFERVARAVVLP